MSAPDHTLIIGASIAGLAAAAALQRRGIPYVMIERQDRIAAPWRGHYLRLHLHTSKAISHLPFRKFGREVPRYPSRQQVVDYLDDYRKAFRIEPLFDTAATTIGRSDGHWVTETNKGSFRSANLILATGVYDKPRPFDCPGLDGFPGTVLHSRDYATGKAFSGRRVLVVGFGNSACEIAIDLFEQGATASMSVRSPVNVVPRDVIGIPILRLSALLSVLPPRVADRLSGPLMRWIIGDITRLGLRRKSYGPLEEIARDGHPPVLDIGTIRHIRQKHIKVFPGIDHIDGPTVYFADGRAEAFDVIVAAVGYDPGYAQLLDVGETRLADARLPIGRQKYFGVDGLYFCGYWISPTGQIASITADAKKIAAHIARRPRRVPTPLLLAILLTGCLRAGAQDVDSARIARLLPDERLLAPLRYLASDQLRGRYIGRPEIDTAARYIAEQFRAAGVRTVPGADGYFQVFNHTFSRLSRRYDPTSQVWANMPWLKAETKGLTLKNVIGYISGTDDNLKHEYILLSSHYDHIGVADKVVFVDGKRDSIFNGAMDNATGTAAVIAAARYFARHPPKRSVLFICYTAEEEGVIGSEYYASHPLIPLNRTVYNLNTDNAAYNTTTAICLFGLGRTSEDSLIQKAARVYRLRVRDEPNEGLMLFYRSDNISLAEKGIPAPTFSLGIVAWDKDMDSRYHQVIDEVGNMDLEYTARFLSAYILAAQYIADDVRQPRWTKGDAYEKTWIRLFGKPPSLPAPRAAPN